MGWVRRVAIVSLLAAAGCGSSDQQPVATQAAAPAADCAELTAIGPKVAAAMAGQATNTAAPKEELANLARTAPEAIRPDIATIAGAYSTLVGVLDAMGETPDAEALAQLERTVKSMDQQALVSANQNVTAWVTAHC